MKKNLILFTDIFSIGGLQMYNRHLCDALESEFEKDKFIAISLLDNRKNRFRYWKNINIEFCDLMNLKLVKKAVFIFKTLLILLAERPQFLICGHVDMSPIGLFLNKVFGLKYIVLTQGIDVWKIRNGLKYLGLANATFIVTISQYTKEKMVNNGVDINKIRLLYPTVDKNLFHPKPVNQSLLNKLGLLNKRVLLTIGRVSSKERYKGHDVMLEVLKKLNGEYVWLVIGDGDDLSRLQQKAKNLGIDERVKFLGEMETGRLIECYNICDCFIMPSKGEGFGIVFLEAMACGKPVIAGNCDGSTEALMNGKLGFLVDPDSPEEIIQVINSVFTIKENRTNPEYLRQQVEANFGIQVFNKKVKEIFEKILK